MTVLEEFFEKESHYPESVKKMYLEKEKKAIIHSFESGVQNHRDNPSGMRYYITRTKYYNSIKDGKTEGSLSKVKYN